MADAVTVEPVSTPKFLANREKNREFCKLVAFGAAETPNRAVVAGLLMQIPYSMEQGIILVEQGILAQEQGILLAKTEIHRRMRFSVHTRRPSAVCERLRRAGSARLAQEEEGCSLIFLTRCKKKAAQIIARPRPRPLGSGGNVWRSPQGRACSSVRKLLLRFGNRGAGSGKQPPDQNT